ncbi:hypothetical protein [Pseudomonas fluorescens]|uniref:Uncharacterized protein n=1 Tax=Pseudomonas fluorescens TaxID=294 RepID=A0A5E6TPN6_PSEFL|nr:hypothetical protein [Pseudomonas fluorescens]VVM89788.1 hypothetical protein PS655_02755 [Pseudomonas fluorescens]
MNKIIYICCVVLSGSVWAGQPSEDAINQMYNSRVDEMMESTGMNFENAVATKSIASEWRANNARAQLKFSKPMMYYGRLSKVLLNDGNADLLLDSGSPSEVTVTLSAYQAWPWKLTGDEWSIGGVQSNLQFAANLDAGAKLYFQCRRVEFVGKIYLVNCLAFPEKITN